MQLFGILPSCVVVWSRVPGSHVVARQLIAISHMTKLISLQFVKPTSRAAEMIYSVLIQITVHRKIMSTCHK
jgi:hypothetical protein